MYPRTFEYHSPDTLPEALALLKKYGEDAKVLAGGQSLIPMMKLRIASPPHVVDITRIPGLGRITATEGELQIGSLVRHADVEYSPDVASKAPIMREAAHQIADPQVRNLGTIGGAICHADPAADWPAVMLAVDAKLVVNDGSDRVVPMTDFIRGPFETAVQQGEILTGIRVASPNQPRSGYSYMKFERKVGDFATVGVAATVGLTQDGTVGRASIALTAVAPMPFRATEAETSLLGKAPTTEALEEAGRLASSKADPTGDLRGSAEYKKDMARVFTRRALQQAVARAQGGS